MNGSFPRRGDTSLFKWRESAQLLTKDVLEFVIRNFVIEVDPFKLASRLEYNWGSAPISAVGCHSPVGDSMRDST